MGKLSPILAYQRTKVSSPLIILFIIASMATGCNSNSWSKTKSAQERTVSAGQQNYYMASLDNQQELIFAKMNEKFEILDTTFKYQFVEERNPYLQNEVRVDHQRMQCYFFDYKLDGQAEAYLFNYLVKVDFKVGTATEVFDFKDYSISNWEINYERNTMYFTDYEKQCLYKFNLQSKKTEMIWDYSHEASLHHLKMEFTGESVSLYYKDDFITKVITFDQKESSKPATRKIWTSPPPQCNTNFEKNANLYHEVTTTKLGDEHYTLFVYNNYGVYKSKKLPHKFEGRVRSLWLDSNIVIWDKVNIYLYYNSLEFIKKYETTDQLELLFIAKDFGIVFYSVRSPQNYYLLKPDLTFSSIPDDVFANVIFLTNAY